MKLNGRQIHVQYFAAGEPEISNEFVKWLGRGINILEVRYRDDRDLMEAYYVKRKCSELGYELILDFSYMPHGRMDKDFKGKVCTLPYVCDFINWQRFKGVVVYGPHSKKTTDLLENAIEIKVVEEWLPIVMERVGFSKEYDHIVLPDLGGEERFEALTHEYSTIFFKKERDEITGIPTVTHEKGEVNKNSLCIIVEDIAGKGTTSLLTATQLREMGARIVILLVCHFEETVFKGKMLSEDSPIAEIYTSSTLTDQEHEKITYLKVNVKEHVKKILSQ